MINPYLLHIQVQTNVYIRYIRLSLHKTTETELYLLRYFKSTNICFFQQDITHDRFEFKIIKV